MSEALTQALANLLTEYVSLVTNAVSGAPWDPETDDVVIAARAALAGAATPASDAGLREALRRCAEDLHHYLDHDDPYSYDDPRVGPTLDECMAVVCQEYVAIWRGASEGSRGAPLTPSRDVLADWLRELLRIVKAKTTLAFDDAPTIQGIETILRLYDEQGGAPLNDAAKDEA